MFLGLWAFEQKNTGDYFAQNTDVVQPGPIPPWYLIFPRLYYRRNKKNRT